ncbi:MAG TPA: amino acid racemase [Candidatus Angelobacter sp.]|nr:amino acid racemase [Candidatus Angelobacter sp.]
MKIIGMIGGIGPESTIDYYKRLLDGTQKRNPGSPAPTIIINSIDLQKGLALLGANQLNELTEFIVPEVMRLARAGAEFGFLAANSPHIVFDDISRRSPIPLISIVEATCTEAKARGVTKLGLLGTRFTMHGRFYPEVFTREGIAVIVPTPEEQDYIHDKYINELIPGQFLPQTRESLLTIARRMRDKDGIQALILGGTELPLILTDNSALGIPFLDTTQIHVEEILSEAAK